MATQKGLGKGLGALFGDINEQTETPAEGAVSLPLQKIEPNPLQPRKTFDPDELASLAESIRMHGIIQPLTVRKLPSGFYQIIAGERRWRAARLAGLSDVPVVIIEADDKKAMELALIENLQRADLNPIEEALGYQELMGTYEMTQEQAAARVGKSRPAVANALRLLSLSPAVLELVKDGALSAGHARALLPVKDEAQQLSLAQKVMALGLSVRQTEALCKKLLDARLERVAELKALGREHLDAVVLVRIVRGGDDHARIRVQIDRQICDRRRRDDAKQNRVAAAGRQARDERAFEHVGGNARVLADDDGRLRAGIVRERDGCRLPDAVGELRVQCLVGHAADAVGPK